MKRLLTVTSLLFLSAVVNNLAAQQKKVTLFSLMNEKETGISFLNAIQEDDSLNVMRYEYLYNGAGVGIGDFNNDGLKDIVFTANQVSSRIYINKGGNRFEDITERAGMVTHVWATGVSIVDINNDGYDDI